MPARITWLSRENRGIESIFDCISGDSPSVASQYVEGIVELCEGLRSFPRTGRRFRRQYRVLVYQNHLIFYRYEAGADEIFIVSIIDGRRNVAALFREE